MISQQVKVRITVPFGEPCPSTGRKYLLNFGKGVVKTEKGINEIDTYIIGITHPVKKFEGKIIALIKKENKVVAAVAANKNSRFVNYEIEEGLFGSEIEGSYTLDCLYENSCGAVVYRMINGLTRFLLIKNKRSAHWGFPKGHIEKGENQYQTAKREVFEETGINIDIIEGFSCRSDYRIGGRVEKSVVIFLATTADTQTIIQRDEIEDYIWLNYEQALEMLNFENDKNILIQANEYMLNSIKGDD